MTMTMTTVQTQCTRPAFAIQLTTLLLLLLLPWAALADADMDRLARYRLTLATLIKFEVAVENLAALAKRAPVALRKEQEDDDPGIAEIAAFYDSRPPMREAITRAGLTSVEFTVFMLAWTQAAIAHSFTQSLPPAQRAQAITDSGASVVNVDFVVAHKARLQALGEKIKSIGPRASEARRHPLTGAR